MSTLIHPKGALQAHALSLAFPEMDDVEYRELCEAIDQHGSLREDIVLLDGKVLDGRHRYRACIDLGIQPTFINYNPSIDGESVVEFVMDKNFRRRHLTMSQKAAVATKFLPELEKEAKQRQQASQFKKGNVTITIPSTSGTTTLQAEPTFPEPPNILPMMPPDEHQAGDGCCGPDTPATPPTTTPEKGKKKEHKIKGKGGSAAEQIAKAFGTSATMVRLAKRIKKADEELFTQVLNSKITVNEAIKIVEAREQEAEETGKRAKEKQERIDALVAIGDLYGTDSQVYKAASGKSILKKHSDLLAFAQLQPNKTKSMIPLLAMGWDLTKTQRFLDGKITTENSLEDFQNIAIAQGEPAKEPFVAVLGKWTFTASLAE